jgi:GT2 family glycosyltransferase
MPDVKYMRETTGTPGQDDEAVAATVVIATRNRSGDLKRCLARLQNMAGVGRNWEILVADNGSTDATPEVVLEAALTSPVPVRYLFEGRRGKSAALNTAIAEARGAILAFTDDDCLPDESWLRNVLLDFAVDPDLAVLGGRVELYDERDKPISLVRCNRRTQIPPENVFHTLLACPADVEQYGSVIGANMAVRRETFAKIGVFDLFLAPGSTRTALCIEDSDFVYRACRSGLKVAYSPEPLVYHNHGRRTDSDLKAVKQRYTRGLGAFYFKYALSGDMRITKTAYWELKSYWKSLCRPRLDPAIRKDVWGLTRDLLVGMATQFGAIGRNRSAKQPRNQPCRT